MFNLWLAQLKREYWEHKTYLIRLPLIFSGIAISALLVGILFFISLDNKDIHIQADGDLNISFSQTESPIVTLVDTSQLNDLSTSGAEQWQAMMFDFPSRKIDKISEMERDRSSITLKKEGRDKVGVQGDFLYFVVACLMLGLIGSSLSADRKDNSILLWRSLPVPESRSVLVKYFNALAVLPILYMLISIGAMLIMVGMLALTEWSYVPNTNLYLTLFLVEVFTHYVESVFYNLWLIIWMSPFFIWVGLVASFANRLAAVYAVSPIIVICLIEWIIFRTKHFLTMLGYYTDKGIDSVNHLHGGQFDKIDFSLPIIGIAISILFTVLTIGIRKFKID